MQRDRSPIGALGCYSMLPLMGFCPVPVGSAIGSDGVGDATAFPAVDALGNPALALVTGRPDEVGFAVLASGGLRAVSCGDVVARAGMEAAPAAVAERIGAEPAVARGAVAVSLLSRACVALGELLGELLGEVAAAGTADPETTPWPPSIASLPRSTRQVKANPKAIASPPPSHNHPARFWRRRALTSVFASVARIVCSIESGNFGAAPPRCLSA
jgi:hypothetical protein